MDMHLTRATFTRNVNLILGAPYPQTMTCLDVGRFPDVPFVEETSGDIQVFRRDGYRITIPTDSIAVRYRNASTAVAPMVPTAREYQVESVNLAEGIAVQLGSLGAIETWRRDRHSPMTSCTVRDRLVVIAMPNGGIIEIPFASVGWITSSPIAEPSILVENDWPETETTPAAPRRSSRRS